jgi:hypothetical protein
LLSYSKETGREWGKALIFVGGRTAARRATVEDKKTLVDKVDAFIFDCDGEDRLFAWLHVSTSMIVVNASVIGQRGAE